MFNECNAITAIGKELNTSKVEHIEYMFNNCSKISSLNLGANFDTTKVTSMENLFNGCSSLTALNLGANFDTSNVTNMKRMFSECRNLTNINLGEKFSTVKVTDMSYMFNECKKISSLEIQFNTEKVENMENMFNECSELTTLKLGTKFSTVNVTNMRKMFTSCTSMQTLDLGPAFTKIPMSMCTDFVANLGSTTTVVYVGESIYGGTHFFKEGSESNATINYATGTIECKYKLNVKKVSSTLNKENKSITVIVDITEENTTYKANSSDLNMEKIHVFIDGIEANDITKTLLNSEEITGGARFTIKLSDFEQGVKNQKYKEWSGNVSLSLDRKIGVDIYGNGNLDTEIKDEELNKNTEGKLFIDFIEPEIKYKYAETKMDYNKNSISVVFDATEKYIDNTKTTLSLSDLKLKVTTIDENGNTQWTDVDINDSTINSLTHIETKY